MLLSVQNHLGWPCSRANSRTIVKEHLHDSFRARAPGKADGHVAVRGEQAHWRGEPEEAGAQAEPPAAPARSPDRASGGNPAAACRTSHARCHQTPPALSPCSLSPRESGQVSGSLGIATTPEEPARGRRGTCHLPGPESLPGASLAASVVGPLRLLREGEPGDAGVVRLLREGDLAVDGPEVRRNRDVDRLGRRRA